jgi:hypothetical protein
MKLIFFILTITLLSCSQQQFKPAESALDAAREFKLACLNGDFDKAFFYTSPNNINSVYKQKLKENYSKLSSSEKKESKEASIIIKSIKQQSNSLTQIISTNSFSKIVDTITVVQLNNIWQVQLK